ncbi:MAG: hypothetical protein KAS52_01050 [Candidatus Heimdallarchaeota archaeon]|nr:hypothetical protein [Candidatus Heimdallarchaeota archaeon]
MTTKVEKIKKPKGEDNFFEDIFDSFKQAVILLVMLIVYNLIPLGIAFGGYYWAYMSTAFTTGYTDLLNLITGMLSDPASILSTTLEWGHYIIAVGAILAIVSTAAAFLFTASRNDKIAKPVSFFKGFLGAWGILFTYVILLAILGAIYFVIGMYVTNVLVVNIVSIVIYVLAAFVPLAMVFRVIDYLLELE